MTTAYANTIEEAKAIPSDGQGWFLVLSQETLDQIRSAEEAGGFEGGMSGASGRGGFSAPGSTGRVSSSSSELPAELLDLEGSVSVGAFVAWGYETIVAGIHDIWEAFHGNPSGPIIVVPKRELERFLGLSDRRA
jgi:hypothetical protein